MLQRVLRTLCIEEELNFNLFLLTNMEQFNSAIMMSW